MVLTVSSSEAEEPRKAAGKFGHDDAKFDDLGQVKNHVFSLYLEDFEVTVMFSASMRPRQSSQNPNLAHK